jgi:hypothetical protein
VTSLLHLPDIDFSAAVVASQSTNPWMVLLLGSISGLLAFALSNALRVVIVRYPAQKARLRLTWLPALAIITLVGFAIGELQLRRQRAAELLEGRVAGRASRGRFRVDWGGDPNEFHEFVVGVGLVSRRISTGSATARPVPTSPTSVRSASSDSIGSGEASLSLLQDVAT